MTTDQRRVPCSRCTVRTTKTNCQTIPTGQAEQDGPRPGAGALEGPRQPWGDDPGECGHRQCCAAQVPRIRRREYCGSGSGSMSAGTPPVPSSMSGVSCRSWLLLAVRRWFDALTLGTWAGDHIARRLDSHSPSRAISPLPREEATNEIAQYVHDMRSRWSLPRTYWLDALIVVLTTTAVLELVFRRDSPRAPESPVWFGVTAVVIMVLPLFARRRFPFGARAVYWLLGGRILFRRRTPDSVRQQRVRPRDERPLSCWARSRRCTASADRPRRRARRGGDDRLQPARQHRQPAPLHPTGVRDLVARRVRAAGSGPLRPKPPRYRRPRPKRERDAVARIAVAEERTRIARELHDIVAHAVSVMVLQVGAVRHGVPASLANDRDTLRGVEQVGRTALTEMRRLLAAMRLDGEEAKFMSAPRPRQPRLSGRRDRPRRSACRRCCRRSSRFRCPVRFDLSAYRIAQEGLTNALKHARATKAELTLDYRPGELRIDVRDDVRRLPRHSRDVDRRSLRRRSPPARRGR